MNLKSPLKTHPKPFEKGVVLVIVSLVLLLVSWVVSDLYIQSTLGLKMVMNVDKAIDQQMKAEQKLRQIVEEREAILNRLMIEEPKTYVEKYTQLYAKEILGTLPESLIGYCIVANYQISYEIPLGSRQQGVNVKILSWSKLGGYRLLN